MALNEYVMHFQVNPIHIAEQLLNHFHAENLELISILIKVT